MIRFIKEKINFIKEKIYFKKIIISAICIWCAMSLFLSVKVYMWEKSAYENYGENNPYTDVMNDVDYFILGERDTKKTLWRNHISLYQLHYGMV